MVLRNLAILVGLTLSSRASAQAHDISTGEPTLAEKLTGAARNAARDGRCDTIAIIGRRVRELDARYHGDVFAVDPIIAACVPGRRMPDRDRPTAIESSAINGSAMTPPRDAPLPVGEYKDPGTALALSLGVTGGGLALILAAAAAADGSDSVTGGLALAGSLMVTIGPTTGHIYAGNAWNTGLKWRLGSLGVATGALAGALALCPPFSRCTNDGAAAALGVVFAGAGITYIGATIYEAGTAGASARRHNETHQLEVGVAPIVGREPGLAFVGRF
jgi:hypothetical protein